MPYIAVQYGRKWLVAIKASGTDRYYTIAECTLERNAVALAGTLNGKDTDRNIRAASAGTRR